MTEAEKLYAAVLLLELDNGEYWKPEHTESCEALGLDPTNYHALNNDNWPVDMRGKVTNRGDLKRHVLNIVAGKDPYTPRAQVC